MVADAFVARYSQLNPGDFIDTMDLFNSNIPDFDGFAVQAKYAIMHGAERTKEQLTAWKNIEKVIDDFKSFDKYVISVPMWNFGIPYRLKQYLDVLIQPGYTFSYSEESGYEGMVLQKPIFVVYARGGKYENQPEAQALDLQKKYLELALGFMGFENVESVIVEPTLQAGPEVAKTKVAQAVEKAKLIAASF
jgi:FMN-dependent NADH-azoreductase